ncbi:MAG: preprotein translocase subunit Sec61beta [Candidatus Woesearchaeota archaeon]|nr:MAG: preprotein translocase subunit Sec61beta [Candidatus Woesearchaeota archaeon]
MVKPGKISTPASVGGLVRYFQDEYSSKLMLRPEYVIAICIIVAALAVILNMYGRGWVGF